MLEVFLIKDSNSPSAQGIKNINILRWVVMKFRMNIILCVSLLPINTMAKVLILFPNDQNV